MAGHHKVNDHLIIDTHGNKIIDPVYELLDVTIKKLGRDVPVLLERDFNIPQLSKLQREMNTIKKIKKNALKESKEYAAA
jgi:hypothetical protein